MTMATYKLAGKKRLSTLVKREYDPEYCREQYTLLAGDGSERAVIIGTPLAIKRGDSAISAVASADAGNTGDGTLTLANPAFTSAVNEGTYSVVCTTGGADGASKFRVEDPKGKHVGTATGGAAFTGHVKFTIAGGGAAFVEGDKFTVAVGVNSSSADNKVVAWDPGSDDEIGELWGLAINDVTAADGVDNQGGLAIDSGPAIVSLGAIVWPDGITTAQKDDAVQALRAKLIKAR